MKTLAAILLTTAMFVVPATAGTHQVGGHHAAQSVTKTNSTEVKKDEKKVEKKHWWQKLPFLGDKKKDNK